MHRIFITFVGSALLLSACGSTQSKIVTPVQKQDKQMACMDILLEINESEFWKERADKNRGLNARNILRPLGYGSTYLSSAEAMNAAETRIGYLQRIYDIRHCGDAENQRIAGYAPPPATSQAHALPYPSAAVQGYSAPPPAYAQPPMNPVNYNYPPTQGYATQAPYREF